MRRIFSAVIFSAVVVWLALAMPAAAVTTSNITLTLQWERTYFTDVQLETYREAYDFETLDSFQNLGTVDAGTYDWGLPHMTAYENDVGTPVFFNPDETVTFKLIMQATSPDDFPYMPVDFPYRAVLCDFNGTVCTGGSHTTYDHVAHDPFGNGDFRGFWGTEAGYAIEGNTAVGSTFHFNHFSDWSPSKVLDDGFTRVIYRDSVSQFTVLEAEVRLTTMPVPGALPLLAGGLMGLAVLKRRRRRAPA